MNCITCGKEIPEGSSYCNHCGTCQNQITEGSKKSVKKRGNGQGSVYKRNGKWAAEVTLGYFFEDGKKKRKIRRKSGFERKKDALAYIEQLRTELQPRKNITVGDLYEMLVKEYFPKLSKSKKDAYGIAWKKISGMISYRPIETLTVPQLQNITDDAGSSYYTKRDIKNLLSHLYKIAIRDDHADKNRAQYIQLPEYETEERTVFSEDEIELLWSFSDQYIVQHILVMLYTGIRAGEMLTIKVSDVHIPDHYMTGGIKTRKSKARKIIIPDKIAQTLADIVRAAEGDRISNYTKNNFYDAWSEFRTLHGIRQELTPYCCRHTYITRLTALKVSPAMLQELAGHEDYDTTLEYTHLSIADRLAEVNRLR